MVAELQEQISSQRTTELNLRNVSVIANLGDKAHFYCIIAPENKTRALICPACGGRNLRNQGCIHRKYLDALITYKITDVIQLIVKMHKYKCLSPECGTVFYLEKPDFAEPRRRITRRLENEITRLFLTEDYSYARIEKLLKGKLSRQSIRQICYRRQKELREHLRDPSTPLWFRKFLLHYRGNWQDLNETLLPH